MKLKDIIETITIIERYKYDENKNIRPDIQIALINLERDRLLRLKQRKEMKDNFEPQSSVW